MTDIERCQYMVIKYAHDPLRMEPVNVGVVLRSVSDPSRMLWSFDGTMRRVEQLYPSVSTRNVKAILAAFKEMAQRAPESVERGFGNGSVMVTQPRAVRCADMAAELADLFDTYVAPAAIDTEEPRQRTRSSRYVKGRLNDIFKELGVFNAVSTDERAQRLRSVKCKSGVTHTFDFAYQNGRAHRIDAISFDHGTNSERIGRARSFANLVEDVLGSADAGNTVIEAVVQLPTESLEAEIYDEARQIMDTVKLERTEVRTDDDLKQYCLETKKRLAA